MNKAKQVATTLDVTERHARRLIAEGDPRVNEVLLDIRYAGDPVGKMVYDACQRLVGMEEHPFIYKPTFPRCASQAAGREI